MLNMNPCKQRSCTEKLNQEVWGKSEQLCLVNNRAGRQCPHSNVVWRSYLENNTANVVAAVFKNC